MFWLAKCPIGLIWVHFIPVEVIPEIGVCGGGSPPAHPYFRNFSARLKHARLILGRLFARWARMEFLYPTIVLWFISPSTGGHSNEYLENALISVI